MIAYRYSDSDAHQCERCGAELTEAEEQTHSTDEFSGWLCSRCSERTLAKAPTLPSEGFAA